MYESIEDGSVRLCGNYKFTINKALSSDPYLMPSVQEVLNAVSRIKCFAKLDMAQAYKQLTVDEESAAAQTVVI